MDKVWSLLAMQRALCGKNPRGNYSLALHVCAAPEDIQESSSQMLLDCPDFSISSVGKERGVVRELTKRIWSASMTGLAQSLHWDNNSAT